MPRLDDTTLAQQAVHLVRLSVTGLTAQALADALGVGRYTQRRVTTLAVSWGLLFNRKTATGVVLWVTPEEHHRCVEAAKAHRAALGRARYLRRKGATTQPVEPADECMSQTVRKAAGLPAPKTTAPASVFHNARREIKSTY